MTSLISLVNIDENDAFLMLIGGKELYLYDHKKRDCKEIDFGEELGEACVLREFLEVKTIAGWPS